MKYVLTAQPYREFRGYVFVKDKPVTILDRGTLDAIKREPEFEEYHEEETQQETTPTLLDSCPKCGRNIGRGKTMHIRFCKGKI